MFFQNTGYLPQCPQKTLFLSLSGLLISPGRTAARQQLSANEGFTFHIISSLPAKGSLARLAFIPQLKDNRVVVAILVFFWSCWLQWGRVRNVSVFEFQDLEKRHVVKEVSSGWYLCVPAPAQISRPECEICPFLKSASARSWGRSRWGGKDWSTQYLFFDISLGMSPIWLVGLFMSVGNVRRREKSYDFFGVSVCAAATAAKRAWARPESFYLWEVVMYEVVYLRSGSSWQFTMAARISLGNEWLQLSCWWLSAITFDG